MRVVGWLALFVVRTNAADNNDVIIASYDRSERRPRSITIVRSAAVYVAAQRESRDDVGARQSLLGLESVMQYNSRHSDVASSSIS